MQKIINTDWSEFSGAPNPVTGISNGSYAERVLGDVAGLTQFGVRVERLPPGSSSSHRHWHETEDEFVYVISGELVLVEDQETVLSAGDAAGWAAGDAVAHCLENRSDAPATYLVVGTRAEFGTVHYPDHDVVLEHGPVGRRFWRPDGTPIEPRG